VCQLGSSWACVSITAPLCYELTLEVFRIHTYVSNNSDGVITDDSDVFLFGAQRVYRNIFGEGRKDVESCVAFSLYPKLCSCMRLSSIQLMRCQVVVSGVVVDIEPAILSVNLAAIATV
jgi:hypothetical protein